MKKFWKKTEGFTLVELIVVIAILGILSGVGTVGYSGYVKKANMAADMALASEVSRGLELFYYGNPNVGSGYVVLVPEGTTYPNSDGAAYQNGAAAMTAVFGENWANSMKLKYGDWQNSGILDIVSEQGEDADVILSSSYLNGSTTDELLGDVSSLTGSALSFLNKKNVAVSQLYGPMAYNFAGDDQAGFNALCESYGIKITTNEDGSYQFGEKVTHQDLANLMVVASADNLSKFKNGESDMSQAGAVVSIVASYKGFVASEYASAEDKQAYDDMLNAMDIASSIEDVNAATEAFAEKTAINYDKYLYDNDSEQSLRDEAAFLNIMQAVNSLSGEVAGKLGDPELFAAGGMFANYFDSYVGAVAAREELAGLDIPNDAVVIFLNANNGAGSVSSSASGILP